MSTVRINVDILPELLHDIEPNIKAALGKNAKGRCRVDTDTAAGSIIGKIHHEYDFVTHADDPAH